MKRLVKKAEKSLLFLSYVAALMMGLSILVVIAAAGDYVLRYLFS